MFNLVQLFHIVSVCRLKFFYITIYENIIYYNKMPILQEDERRDIDDIKRKSGVV